MQEFICPNGRMSVNGVCPIFEGDDGQVKDFNKPKEKGFFKFDFEKPTENAFEPADNIISNNLNAYNSFVEEKLGIPGNVQNLFRIGATVATGSLMPFAIPFIAGGALNAAENRRVQNITMQDTQGDIQTYNMQNKGNPNPYGGGKTGIQSGIQTSGFASDGGPVSNKTGKGRRGF